MIWMKMSMVCGLLFATLAVAVLVAVAAAPDLMP